MKQALQTALDTRGYTDLTPVQKAVSDPALDGRDMLVSAQTGSGKTVGFGLAIATRVLGEAEAFDQAAAPLALVIAPTRELALQVKRELAWLYAPAGAVMASCVGGMDMRDERRALARGAHIVAATPGRLRDHIMRGSIDLSQLQAVVLDEADEMLDLGFREDLEFILGAAPEDRQTLLFSATVPKSIIGLAKSYQRDAERVITKSEAAQHADISYSAHLVAPHDTDKAVINTLLYHRSPNAIVFANTRAMVARLTARLSNRGMSVVSLSGELSQSERTHALQAMRDGRAQVCVATDVAARGIDLPNLDLVIHAELPSNHETLLHRSGRTGRAGRKGVSALIVTKATRKKAERILGAAKLRATWEDAPSADAVNARDADRMFADDTWTQALEASEEETVARLEATFTPAQLGAAFLRLYRSVRATPEELSAADAKPAPREEFGPSVWYAVTGGHAAGAEPRRLLPMLCKASELTKDDIGAIRIRDAQSFVQIKASSAAAFDTAVPDGHTLEPGAVVTKLAEAPDLGGPPKGKGKPPFKSGGKPKVGDKPKYGEKPQYGEKPKYEGKPKPKFEKPGKTGAKYGARKPASLEDGGYDPAEALTETTRKPRHKSKDGPKGPPPPKSKPSSKKNRARVAANKGKPKRAKD